MCSNLAVRHALATCSGSAPLSRRLAPVLLVMALAGCSSVTSTEPPRVTLSDLQVSEVTVFETTLVAKLRVTNPNPEPLTLDGGSFELILDGKKVGSGAVQSTFTIERLDSKLGELGEADAVLDEADAVEQLRERLGSYRKAMADRPGLVTSREMAERDAREILRKRRAGQ